jgi:hypothetical protein
LATSTDWDVLQNTRQEDYSGTTGFARMSAWDRLRWLDMAVDFVNRHRGGGSTEGLSMKPPTRQILKP